MEYQKAYKIAHEISEFFHLNFDGRKKGQLSQIILNNVREGEELEATPEDTDLVTIPRAMVLGLEQTIKSLRAELDKCQHALDDEDSTNG